MVISTEVGRMPSGKSDITTQKLQKEQALKKSKDFAQALLRRYYFLEWILRRMHKKRKKWPIRDDKRDLSGDVFSVFYEALRIFFLLFPLFSLSESLFSPSPSRLLFVGDLRMG